MKLIHIYIKTHNITGLKYLGKTTRDPIRYRGSGVYWLSHIKKYGNNVTTEIIFSSFDKEEIKLKGTELSDLLKVVESDNWANLKPEIGDGGGLVGEGVTERMREHGRCQGMINVKNGHLKRITDTSYFINYLARQTKEEKSAMSKIAGSRSWANRNKEAYFSQDWFKRFVESGRNFLRKLPKEERSARAAKGGRIGGKVSGRNNVINGHLDRIRIASNEAKRGKKWYSNAETGQTGFFKEGEQPIGWVIGRLNFKMSQEARERQIAGVKRAWLNMTPEQQLAKVRKASAAHWGNKNGTTNSD